VLNRLVSTLGAERGSHYQTDLRDVVTQLIQEKADQGERELDAATTATERVEIASRTLADLSATIPTSTGDQGVHGQAQRILAHWQHKRRETCESQDSDRLAKEASLSRARRKARLRIAIPALVISILAGAYGFEAIYGNSPSAPPKLSTFTPQQVSLTRDDNGKLTFAADVACKELAQFAATRLDPAVFKQHTELYGLRFPALANRLNNHLMSWHPEQTADDRQSWADRLGQELSVFDGALKTLHQRARGRQGWLEVHRQISDYGRFAHTTGLHQLAISVDGLKQFESMLSAMDRYEFIAADQQLTEIQRQLQQNDQR